MLSIEQRITHLIESVSFDSVIEDSLLYQLSDELSRSGSGITDPECQRAVWRKTIDFILPDHPQMLYLLLIPECPPVFSVRLESKPYDNGIKIANRRYHLDFEVISKILAESSIENQPLTIIANTVSLSALTRRLTGCTYDLPRGSRILRHTDELAPPVIETEDIFGVPVVDNILCIKNMTSVGHGVGNYRFPAWVRPFDSQDKTLSFIDLSSFDSRGRVDSGMNACLVNGQYVYG